MKTNSRIKSVSKAQRAPQSNDVDQGPSDAMKTPKPSYQSMMDEVAKISQHRAFSQLKIFFGLDATK